ncbi:nucleoid-associated protein, partial [Acinetobacter baumannii]|nr:nucleoid-associated protein [Acinetobacter baumannii]
MKYDFVQSYLKDIVIHRVGNKFISEECVFAKHSSTLDEQFKLLLTHFFLKSFNSNDLYQFTNKVNLDLNVVYSCVKSIFENPVSIYEQSLNIAKYLYSKSIHPNIKGGEFFICYFKDCNFEEKLIDAVGIFKTEIKDTFLEVEQLSEEVILHEKHGININKLDKGCVVFNINKEDSYSLLVVDNVNKANSARYWKDDFLSAKIRHDDFYKTKYLLDLTKKFVKIEDFLTNLENNKNKDVEILCKSSNYFKENEEFYFK